MMQPEIEHYTFGRMTVNGKEYTADLIIHADGTIQDRWWRQRGHDLIPEDIDALFAAPPRRLIIGTGADGRMSVGKRVLDRCRAQDIAVEALPTAEAARRFNAAVAQENASVAGCFHLTC